MPDYFHNKPVDLLTDPARCAEDFNDDSLGRSLDDLYQAGVTEVFARVARQALEVYGIEHCFVHLDSSSLHLHGQYKAGEPNGEAITVTHGYSRDHCPDLKQLVVQLVTSQRSALPVCRDVTFQEDLTRMTHKNMGRVMAMINNLVISLLNWQGFDNHAHARRVINASPAKALALIRGLYERHAIIG